jgi:hypothetical protein
MISILFIPTICGSNLHLSALAMDLIKPTFPGFRRQRASLSGFSASMATSSTRDGCRRQPKRWLPASRLSSREAIYEACLKRFRPIMMTTMAALLGAVLLAIDFGEGSELRRSLGISIVGGLIVSQILTLQDAGHLRLSRPLPLMGGTALAQSTPGPAFEGRHSQSRRVSHAT